MIEQTLQFIKTQLTDDPTLDFGVNEIIADNMHVLSSNSAKEGKQPKLDHRLTCRNGQLPRAGAKQRLGTVAQTVEGSAYMRQPCLALDRQGYGPRPAVKKHRAQPLLQMADPLADGRLGQPGFSRGGGKAATARGGLKGADPLKRGHFEAAG